MSEIIALLRAGAVPTALDAAREAVQARPTDLEAHEILIDILMSTGMGPQALSAYNVLTRDYPNAAWAHYLHGRASLDAQTARAAYRNALDIDPTMGRAWMGVASIDRAQGQFADAETGYRRALDIDPLLSEAWSGLASLLVRAGRRGEALELLSRAITTVPNEPEPYMAAASLSPGNALTYLRKGAAAVPGDPRLLAALARALTREGELEEARDAWAQAVVIYPSNPEANLALALADAELAGHIDAEGREALAVARATATEGDPGDAREAMDALITRYPDCFLVWLGRGHLLAETGDRVAAESDLRRAYALAPTSIDAQAALGLLLLATGRHAEAAPALDAAAATRPHDIQLGLAAAMAHFGVEGHQTGVQMLARLSDRFPSDPRPPMMLAGAMSRAGDIEGAYAVLSRAVERAPEPSLVVALAAAATDLGHPEEAAALLRRLGEATGNAAMLEAADRLSP